MSCSVFAHMSAIYKYEYTGSSPVKWCPYHNLYRLPRPFMAIYDFDTKNTVKLPSNLHEFVSMLARRDLHLPLLETRYQVFIGAKQCIAFKAYTLLVLSGKEHEKSDDGWLHNLYLGVYSFATAKKIVNIALLRHCCYIYIYISLVQANGVEFKSLNVLLY